MSNSKIYSCEIGEIIQITNIFVFFKNQFGETFILCCFMFYCTYLGAAFTHLKFDNLKKDLLSLSQNNNNSSLFCIS